MNISVIIPIYNAADYLEKCISSILGQTYQEFELIIVNDGSTDHSLEVLQNLLPQNENIKIITQNNQGVSSARNTGLVHATGKYLAFIDSDDYVDQDYLKTLFEATNKETIDWVLSGTSYYQESEIIRVVTMPEDIWNTSELDNKYRYIDNTTSIHGKLYKKDIIEKHNLRFDTSMSFAEDRDFNVEYIKSMQFAHNIPYVGYTYCTDIPNSLSKKKYHYKFKNDCIYWCKVLSLNNNNSFKVFVANRFYNSIADNIDEMIKWLGIKHTLNIISRNYQKKYRTFISSYISFINAPKWQKHIIINYPRIYCILINIINKLHE